MTYKENVRAILECHFSGFKEEIIESACNRILEQEERDIKTGYWIGHECNGLDYIECSGCSTWFKRLYLVRNSYCPNCGARMESYKNE